MSRTSEFVDFRRAFWWLLGGVLLPSVALVAFGVVAVANERAAAERRLSDQYGVRLHALETVLRERLDDAARSVLRSGAADPLVRSIRILDEAARASLSEAAQRADTLSLGQHLFAVAEPDGVRVTYALVRATAPVGEWTLAAQLDLSGLERELPALAARAFPGERATFRLLAPPDKSTTLSALRRALTEAAPGSPSGATVAQLPLKAPLDGFLLVAALAGDDPAGTLALRTRILYIALLVLLYASIGVGFGLTLRELSRAARLSRLKTDFVANISHELRTPLTSVRMFAETLQSGRASTPAEVKECLELLSAEAERLSGLVERLLGWSRLESGSRALHCKPVEVLALVTHIAEVFRAQQLGATYTTRLDPDLPRVFVDTEAMEEVILNLLHNAVKYTGKDKRIELRALRAGRMVAIEVRDNGAGIRAQDKKRVFERFYRANDLLARKTEGTGLGLAIAKRIAELHNGGLELESKVGEGSTFRVLIPIDDGRGDQGRSDEGQDHGAPDAANEKEA